MQGLFQPLFGAFYQRLASRHRVQQRQHGVGQVAGHHGRRRRDGHGEAQESELACHRGDSDHGSDAGHQSARVRGWIIDDTEGQEADEQQKLKQEKRPGQGWTASVGRFGDQPNGGNGGHEDRNRQDLGHVRWSAAHQQSRYHHEVAGNMGSE